MNFKLTKQGIVFLYQGDDVLVRWPWVKKPNGYMCQSSLVPEFNNLSEYWVKRSLQEVDILKSGHTVHLDYPHLLADWSRRNFPGRFVVVIHDIDVGARVNDFWRKLPAGVAKKLSDSDVTALLCKDKAQALEIAHAVPQDLGVSYLFKDGVIYDSNCWGD